MEEKKIYTTPLLTIHGKVEEITKSGGGGFVDVPWGTPIGPTGIGSVTGNLS